MTEHTWVLNIDGDLCLSGYPIRIRRLSGIIPYSLEQDGRKGAAYGTLESAKHDAIKRAAELDEFAP